MDLNRYIPSIAQRHIKCLISIPNNKRKHTTDSKICDHRLQTPLAGPTKRHFDQANENCSKTSLCIQRINKADDKTKEEVSWNSNVSQLVVKLIVSVICVRSNILNRMKEYRWKTDSAM